MGLLDYMRFLGAFAFVLALIGLCYWLVRRYAVERLGLATNLGRPARLRIVETRILDGRRRLVLVRRDGVEHLVLIGGESDVVIEAGIPAPAEPEPMSMERAG